MALIDCISKDHYYQNHKCFVLKCLQMMTICCGYFFDSIQDCDPFIHSVFLLRPSTMRFINNDLNLKAKMNSSSSLSSNAKLKCKYISK
ncbi:hypothetical protein DERF_005718 [Dermatophagoides farinae]|uniref:Uncharacterized protein n=1 Tax=Dermatophagoides farinae TaxID=6954 RepID=A0A922L8Z2_DERFA|nr:hypothetical protein DERF_005718 [Dermatophagoides farinae]